MRTLEDIKKIVKEKYQFNDYYFCFPFCYAKS